MKKQLTLSLLACALAANVYAANTGDSYNVVYNNQAPTLDGKLDDGVWKDVKAITDFSNPWVEDKMPSTEFKAYHDDKNLYFAFDVVDPNVVVYDQTDHEWMVAREDRVELFMAPGAIDQANADGSYPKYMALEMDYKGRALSMLRDSQKNVDAKWDPSTLELKGERTDKGYVLEGQISLKELNDLGLIKDNTIQAGVYRAEFSIIEGKGKERADWITWVNPQTEKPNFHINSSFGKFVLEPKK